MVSSCCWGIVQVEVQCEQLTRELARHREQLTREAHALQQRLAAAREEGRVQARTQKEELTRTVSPFPRWKTQICSYNILDCPPDSTMEVAFIINHLPLPVTSLEAPRSYFSMVSSEVHLLLTDLQPLSTCRRVGRTTGESTQRQGFTVCRAGRGSQQTYQSGTRKYKGK